MPKCDFLKFDDFQADFIERLIERAIVLAELFAARNTPHTLRGARVGLLTELPGWRNPTALNLAVSLMGGHSVPVTASLEGSEDIGDLAGYLGNWFDLIAVRTASLERLCRFAEATSCSTMNLRTNDNHPFEVLGDLSYITRIRGTLAGLKVAVVGTDGNIVRSWIEASNALAIDVLQIAPATMAIGPELLGSRIKTTEDIHAVKEVDVIVTDCWPANASEDELRILKEHQIDKRLLDACADNVLFIPCPPVSRGHEVASDAMQHSRCVATKAKNLLMHAQAAFAEQALNES